MFDKFRQWKAWLILATGLMSCPLAAEATPVFDINGIGLMTGVENVVVGTGTYNVSFHAGSCTWIYSDCTNANNFPFASQNVGRQALQALGDALAGTSYQNTPSAFPGYVGRVLDILVPYCDALCNNSVNEQGLLVTEGPNTLTIANFGAISEGCVSQCFGTNDVIGWNWSVWTLTSGIEPSPILVPEPPSIFLLAFGLFCLLPRFRIRCVPL